jgi:hypothetical protein
VTIRHLKGAFAHYCSSFYHSLSQRSLAQTAEGHGAFTLEQAMKGARQASRTSELQKVNTPQLPSKPSNGGPSEAEKRTGTNPSNDADKFLKEIESQVHQTLKAPSMNQTGSIQDASIHRGQASSELSRDHSARMVTLKQLSNEAKKVQQQPSSSSLAKTAATSQSKEGPQRPSVPVAHDNDIETGNAMPLLSANRDKGKEAVRDVKPIDNILLQRKYFPSVDTDSLRCLACAGVGHGTASCPALECTVCGTSGDHSNFTCPQNSRCRRCRQRGHQTTSCPEKLLPSKSEAIPCDICGSKDHLEVACHFIWRSFASEHEVKKVQDIPVHCYTCGGTGHYGTECGILTRPLLSGKVTWSRLNVQKYVDHASEARALSAGIDYSIKKPTKQFNIKGMGGSADPYTIDDSEEEGEFIRPKINNATADRGHIRFGETSRGNNPAREDLSNRTNSSRGAPGMGFDGAYDDDYVPYQMSGGTGSYPPGGYNSYSSGGQYPGQLDVGNAGHTTRTLRSSGKAPMIRQATASVAKSKPKPKPKKKDKKAKKRLGNGN